MCINTHYFLQFFLYIIHEHEHAMLSKFHKGNAKVVLCNNRFLNQYNRLCLWNIKYMHLKFNFWKIFMDIFQELIICIKIEFVRVPRKIQYIQPGTKLLWNKPLGCLPSTFSSSSSNQSAWWFITREGSRAAWLRLLSWSTNRQ